MIRGRNWAIGIAALFVVGAASLAGCTREGEADLSVSAAWQAWVDDNKPHLMLTMTNKGDATARVGPGGDEIVIYGPNGPVPVRWGETNFAREIYPNERIVVGFHPRHDGNGSFGLAIDHASGHSADPAKGPYEVCVGDVCTHARLT